MAKQCNCTDVLLHAKATESAVFQCGLNAMANPEQSARWERQADLLEHKFTSDHGVHYADVIYPRKQ